MNYFLGGSKMEDIVEDLEANKKQKVEEPRHPIYSFNIEGDLIEKNGELVKQPKPEVNLHGFVYSGIWCEDTIFVYGFVISDTKVSTAHVLSKNLLTLEIIKRKMKKFLEIYSYDEEDPMHLPIKRYHPSRRIDEPVFDIYASRNILNTYLKYRELMKEHPRSLFILPKGRGSLDKDTAPCKDTFRYSYNINRIRDRNSGELYEIKGAGQNHFPPHIGKFFDETYEKTLESVSQTLLLEFFDCIATKPNPNHLPYEIIGEISFFR